MSTSRRSLLGAALARAAAATLSSGALPIAWSCTLAAATTTARVHMKKPPQTAFPQVRGGVQSGA